MEQPINSQHVFLLIENALKGTTWLNHGFSSILAKTMPKPLYS
jgi:hypothetical protein